MNYVCPRVETMAFGNGNAPHCQPIGRSADDHERPERGEQRTWRVETSRTISGRGLKIQFVKGQMPNEVVLAVNYLLAPLSRLEEHSKYALI